MRIFGGWVMTWLTVASASAGADDALFVDNDKLRGILLPRQVVAADNTAQNDAAPSRDLPRAHGAEISFTELA